MDPPPLLVGDPDETVQVARDDHRTDLRDVCGRLELRVHDLRADHGRLPVRAAEGPQLRQRRRPPRPDDGDPRQNAQKLCGVGPTVEAVLRQDRPPAQDPGTAALAAQESADGEVQVHRVGGGVAGGLLAADVRVVS